MLGVSENGEEKCVYNESVEFKLRPREVKSDPSERVDIVGEVFRITDRRPRRPWEPLIAAFWGLLLLALLLLLVLLLLLLLLLPRA